MDQEAARQAPSRAASPGAGTSIRSFKKTGGFESTLTGYVHARLRMSATFILAADALLVLTSAVSWSVSGLAESEPFLTPARWTMLACLVVAAALAAPLFRRSLSAATLSAIDAALSLFIVLGSTAFYAVAYHSGPVLLVPVLGLLLVARAVFVPSRPLRTFLLGIPAAPAVAAVALAYGTMYTVDSQPLTHGSYVGHMIWEQVIVWLSVGLATFASHVNFALRLQAFRAAEVGQYQLIDRLGAGAMGEVWRAQHGLMRRPTAIKIIRADVVDEKTLRRFEEEVRQTCRISHPNVVLIYDYGHTADGVFFYAMELLDGVDLQRVVEESGPLPPARVIHVLAQACAGLAEAHARGLVHRDVKAANLFLCERGLESDVVKVVDFGLVKDTSGQGSGATNLGEVCGTPETMAPETIRGRPAAPSVDVYALGAVGCYLLTGKQIFDATAALEFVTCHLTQQPIAPSSRDASVPKDLEDVLLACLTKDPDERIPSVREMRRRLLACAEADRWSQDDAAAWWKARREQRASALPGT